MLMDAIRNTNIKKRAFYLPIFFTIYFIIHLIFLIDFPFVHSDESWLSGLSRHMININSFDTSEPFFIEYPRAIHGLRLVFVSIQMIVIKLLGYSIFNMRLIALFFSTLTLYISSKIFKTLKFKAITEVLALITIAVNIQFIYASHMARQDILILFMMVWAFYLNMKSPKPILTGTLIGISIGIHPNSLLIALGMGLVYIYNIIFCDTTIKELLLLIVTTALWAIGFIFISYMINTNFIQDYLAFGESLGVMNYEISRVEGYYIYYLKLFEQIGGTYALMPIKLDLILLSLTSIIGLIKIKNHTLGRLYSMILAINVGYFLIGRYNQTAILFTLFFNLLFWIIFIKQFKWSKYGLIVLIGLFVSVSFNTISLEHEDYYALKDHYQLEGKVLGNLNMDYHLEDGQLIDYRNLWFVSDFKQYINDHDIKYIILPEEMSYIKQTSPKWDILYGSLPYYDNMMAYLDTCTLIDEFESPTYGIRIARYIDTYPWTIKIYEVPK